jgi:hypothetical protein
MTIIETFMFRLRANLDETRLTLEAKNNSLEKLQQSVLEKEQVCKRNVFLSFFCLMTLKSGNAWPNIGLKSCMACSWKPKVLLWL